MRELTNDSAFVEFDDQLKEDCYDYCALMRKQRKEKPWMQYEENIKFKGRGRFKQKLLKKHHVQFLNEYMQSCEDAYPTVD